jgi:tetratricopeptide (TPR) repeat protein
MAMDMGRTLFRLNWCGKNRKRRSNMNKRFLRHGITLVILAVFAFLALGCGTTETAAKKPAGSTDTAEAAYKRGGEFQGQKNWDKAIESFSQAIKLDPNNANSYLNRGNCYLEKEEYDSAIADYTQAMTLAPNWNGGYNLRGLAYKGKGELDKALDDFTQSITRYPNYGPGYYKPRRYLQGQGREGQGNRRLQSGGTGLCQ